MSQYRYKPVIINAFQFRKDCEFPDWVDFTLVRKISDPNGEIYKLEIHSSDGIMNAHWGDWIIKGDQGEFSHCKSHIFESTFEKVQ